MGQFNPVTMQNVQMSQSPVGAPRAVSPMTHPPQMGMGTVPAVSSDSRLIPVLELYILKQFIFRFMVNIVLEVMYLYLWKQACFTRK